MWSALMTLFSIAESATKARRLPLIRHFKCTNESQVIVKKRKVVSSRLSLRRSINQTTRKVKMLRKSQNQEHQHQCLARAREGIKCALIWDKIWTFYDSSRTRPSQRESTNCQMLQKALTGVQIKMKMTTCRYHFLKKNCLPTTEEPSQIILVIPAQIMMWATYWTTA